jgi:hypothetical protein
MSADPPGAGLRELEAVPEAPWFDLPAPNGDPAAEEPVALKSSAPAIVLSLDILVQGAMDIHFLG